MGLFDIFKKKLSIKESEESCSCFLTLQINARLKPLERGEFYEDPIYEALEASNCGTVEGGGTMMLQNGEWIGYNILNKKISA